MRRWGQHLRAQCIQRMQSRLSASRVPALLGLATLPCPLRAPPATTNPPPPGSLRPHSPQARVPVPYTAAPRLPSLFREMEKEMEALSRGFFGGDLMMRSPWDMLGALRDMPALMPELEAEMPAMRLVGGVLPLCAAACLSICLLACLCWVAWAGWLACAVHAAGMHAPAVLSRAGCACICMDTPASLSRPCQPGCALTPPRPPSTPVLITSDQHHSPAH